MIVVTQLLKTNACAVYVLRKFRQGVPYINNATSEQIKAGTALARACEVWLVPNLNPAESWLTFTVSQLLCAALKTTQLYTAGGSTGTFYYNHHVSPLRNTMPPPVKSGPQSNT